MVTVPAGETIELDLGQHKTADAAFKSLKDASDLTEGETILRKRSIGRCFDSNGKAKSKACSILKTFELGTMFLMGDTKTAFSAFHVFRDFIKGEIKNGSMGAIDLIVQDQAGKIVFGALDFEKARVSFVHQEALKDRTNGASGSSTVTTNPIVDFIQLRLSRSISNSRPLTVRYDLATSASVPVTPLYHIGFPGQTFDRMTIHGKPESNGVDLYATYGSAISLNEYLIRTGKDPKSIDPEVLKLLDKSTLYLDSDSYFGMSGAPVLNEAGEVIGLHIGSFPVSGVASPVKTTVSIRASWIRDLMSEK